MVIPKRIVSDDDEPGSHDTKSNFDEHNKYRFRQSIPTFSAKLSAFRNSAIPSSLFPKCLLITDDIHQQWNITNGRNHLDEHVTGLIPDGMGLDGSGWNGKRLDGMGCL